MLKDYVNYESGGQARGESTVRHPWLVGSCA